MVRIQSSVNAQYFQIITEKVQLLKGLYINIIQSFSRVYGFIKALNEKCFWLANKK